MIKGGRRDKNRKMDVGSGLKLMVIVAYSGAGGQTACVCVCVYVCVSTGVRALIRQCNSRVADAMVLTRENDGNDTDILG